MVTIYWTSPNREVSSIDPVCRPLVNKYVIRSFYSELVFWTDVTKGVWNVVSFQTMNRDGSPEM